MLHVTKHDGKLTGISSINVPVHGNAFCERMRSVEGLVCRKCYAYNLETLRKSIAVATKKNMEILTTRPLAEEDMPAIANHRLVRFNSFGELVNRQHLHNLYAIAERFPGSTFALWTKRADIMNEETRVAPKNMVIIYSEPRLNPETVTRPEWSDYTYAVFTEGPSCGDRCIDCLRCYRHPAPGQDRIIRQRLH